MKKRVVITGVGTINPLADNTDDFYKRLIAGESGIVPWSSIDTSSLECTIGGDLGAYDSMGRLADFKDDLGERYKEVRRLLKSTTFSAKLTSLASLIAFKDAGLFEHGIDPFRTSFLCAGHNLNSNYIYNNSLEFAKIPEYTAPLAGVDAPDPNVPGVASEVLGIKGPMYTMGAACASGNIALRAGYRDIIMGETDVAVIAGAPFDISPTDIYASEVIKAVVVNPDFIADPTRASRPFDRDRCGFLYSHGAGTLIIESLDSALARKAPIYGEILGVMAGSNGNHLPMPGAQEQVRVMRGVIDQAGLKPEDIDYVNCHATSTPAGDVQEALAIAETFGSHTSKLYTNAAKSMLGHTCWASSLVETIAGLLQMKHGTLHPTINVDNQDPRIEMNVCANKPVEHQINVMLKNSFGFGGINCVSLISRYPL